MTVLSPPTQSQVSTHNAPTEPSFSDPSPNVKKPAARTHSSTTSNSPDPNTAHVEGLTNPISAQPNQLSRTPTSIGRWHNFLAPKLPPPKDPLVNSTEEYNPTKDDGRTIHSREDTVTSNHPQSILIRLKVNIKDVSDDAYEDHSASLVSKIFKKWLDQEGTKVQLFDLHDTRILPTSFPTRAADLDANYGMVTTEKPTPLQYIFF